MRLVCGGAPSCQNCRIRFRRIIGITKLVIMEEKRPNDRFRTNAAPNCDFFVMKRHFLNLLRIFSGVNTAIVLIYGPILGLTLQTRYIIKRSGISVKSYGVARWARRIWTTLYLKTNIAHKLISFTGPITITRKKSIAQLLPLCETMSY